MSPNLDQQALDLIDTWEAGEYLHPAQKKAALQVAIRDALAQARAEGLRQAAARAALEPDFSMKTEYQMGYERGRNEAAERIRALAEGGTS